jgi:hypothetical protein
MFKILFTNYFINSVKKKQILKISNKTLFMENLKVIVFIKFKPS